MKRRSKRSPATAVIAHLNTRRLFFGAEGAMDVWRSGVPDWDWDMPEASRRTDSCRATIANPGAHASRFGFRRRLTWELAG